MTSFFKFFNHACNFMPSTIIFIEKLLRLMNFLPLHVLVANQRELLHNCSFCLLLIGSQRRFIYPGHLFIIFFDNVLTSRLSSQPIKRNKCNRECVNLTLACSYDVHLNAYHKNRNWKCCSTSLVTMQSLYTVYLLRPQDHQVLHADIHLEYFLLPPRSVSLVDNTIKTSN